MNKYLKLNFLNTNYDNLLISASGCYGYGFEFKDFFDIDFFGGITLKGITLEPRDGNYGVRIAETPSGMLNCIGLENPGIDIFINEIYPEICKKIKSNIIININGNTIDDYVELAKRIDNLERISAIELNISCPNIKCGGMLFGTDPVMVNQVISLVKSVLKNKPLIVKLSPNVTNIKEIAKIAEESGADAISLINTLVGMEIDIKNQKPLLGNIFGGLSGPAIFPIALRAIYEVYQVVNIPIIGIGGVNSSNDVIKFILAGANLVSIGTLLLTNPKEVIKIKDDLEKYCIENNVKNIQALVGKANRKLVINDK